MHPYYGIYRHVRNAAWQCLCDFDVSAFPVDVRTIARSAGVRLLRDSIANLLQKDERGAVYFVDHSWVIVYDDSLPIANARFTVAHELGHIFLGHDQIYLRYAQTRKPEKALSEKQANQFAIRLLCPACVLSALDLHTAQEIADVCRVPLNVAEQRAKRMKTLYERQKFLTDPLEERVYRQFEPYISNTLEEKRKL